VLLTAIGQAAICSCSLATSRRGWRWRQHDFAAMIQERQSEIIGGQALHQLRELRSIERFV
jgi:hypothetical protein